METNEDVPAGETRAVVVAYAKQFADTYRAAPPAVDVDVNAHVAHAYFPPPNTPPGQWHENYVTTLLHFMAVVQWQLRESIKRLKGTVGRELPLYVMTKFLPSVTATLRDALRLNDVQAGVQKRALALCEPDEEIVARREAVKKRRMALAELEWVTVR